MKPIKRLSKLVNSIACITVDHQENGQSLKGCLVVSFGEFLNKKKTVIKANDCYFFYSSEGNDVDRDKESVVGEVPLKDIKELLDMPKTKIMLVEEEELPKLLESLELLYGTEDDQRTKNPSIC